MEHIVICDDEKDVAIKLKEMVRDAASGLPEFLTEGAQISLFTDGQTFLDEVQEGKLTPSIIVMDIRLGAWNGIQLAKQILQTCPICQVIFISGYDDYVEAVYDVDHIFFMRKPVDTAKMKKALLRAADKLANQRQACFFVKNKSGYYVVPFAEISNFEKNRRKIILHTACGKTYEFYGKFEEIEDKLPASFVRCHHSYLINLALVHGLEKDCFLLPDGRKIPLSRTYNKEAKAKFIDWLSCRMK